MSSVPAARSEVEPARPAHGLTPAQSLYLWLTALFVTCLLIANVVGVKLFSIPAWLPLVGDFKVEHTAGMLPFPLTFLLTDLLNEYYGPRATRRVTYIAFSMAFLAFLLIGAARALPILTGIPGTATQDAFENIFGAASLMYLASIAAFLVGSLLDISLFRAFKRLTGGRYVWLRATGSTVVSQVFDSFVITFLFFMAIPLFLGADTSTLEFVLRTAATGYVLKFFIAVALTPAIYLGRWAIRAGLGLQPAPATA